MAGRGFGKTRTGAETFHKWARKTRYPMYLVGRTSADIRDVMVKGESGLLETAHPRFKPIYQPSLRRVTWPNGVYAITFSAEEPDQLRGPQGEYGWGDEPAAWRYAQEALDMMEMGLRLGDQPRCILTTTPRPTKFIKGLIADSGTVVTHGTTYENSANLASSFLKRMRRKYGGSRLGRQELGGEVIDDNPRALWKRSVIEDLRRSVRPELTRIVVGVDPAVTSNADSNETGIIVAGLGTDGHAYILDDVSLSDKPDKWGAQAVSAYSKFEADRIIGEVNNGGDLVEGNIRAVQGGRDVSYKSVRASRGKQTRAEPVAALYEQGRVHHLGAFAELEDQLCQWDPTSMEGSPDRLDALVWALTELMLGEGDPDESGRLLKGRSSTR